MGWEPIQNIPEEYMKGRLVDLLIDYGDGDYKRIPDAFYTADRQWNYGEGYGERLLTVRGNISHFMLAPDPPGNGYYI
jgi:hypothetical protein